MSITNVDPLLAQEAQIVRVESGGFLVRQVASAGNGPTPTPTKSIETYASNMDAVSGLLTTIFTPPA
jgi:hypothetical protein